MVHARVHRPILAIALAVGGTALVLGQSSAGVDGDRPRISRDVKVVSQDVWGETGIELTPGERAVLSATGTSRCPGEATEFGPAGIPRAFRDLLRMLPVAQGGRGAVIGRIGDAEVAQPFVIGAGTEIVSPAGGVLALGINREADDACTVDVLVHVEVFSAREGGPTAARLVDAVAGVTPRLFADLPRRVNDKQGNPGDMLNFVILGSATGMQDVFKSAGWVTVDPDVRGALVAGLIDSLSKESYLTLPMSQLYLFNRPQDFGWAHAEPIKVVASRHHLRVWHAPDGLVGSTLWVGAATHDIGFDRDRRNNGITHKIDPNVDLERDYLEKTLTRTGLVAEYAYVTPSNPVREAKTATGEQFQSDGRVLVLKLTGN
jgi:hypothetical protein